MSKTVLSKSLKSDNTPKDKEAKILINAITAETITVAFFLEIWQFSIIEAIGVSIILIPDVIAANRIKTKNRIPTKLPNGNFTNISGREIKIKVAPAVGSTPNENTTGKIIIPASIAIRVSKKIKV